MNEQQYIVSYIMWDIYGDNTTILISVFGSQDTAEYFKREFLELSKNYDDDAINTFVHRYSIYCAGPSDNDTLCSSIIDKDGISDCHKILKNMLYYGVSETDINISPLCVNTRK